MEHVSIWDFYPDPDSRNMSEAEFTIQRHRLNRTQMRALKKRPFFREESIELAIDYGSNFIREYWEDSLDDSGMVDSLDRFEVLEYWGVLDSALAEEADIAIPDEYTDRDQIQVNVWVCAGQTAGMLIELLQEILDSTENEASIDVSTIPVNGGTDSKIACTSLLTRGYEPPEHWVQRYLKVV